MYDQPNAQLDTHYGQADAQSDVKMTPEVMSDTVTKSDKNPDKKTVKLFDAPSLKKLESALKNAPLPAKKVTRSEALSELIPELKRQQERGHTAASLAAVLDASGLRVSERKLAQLLRH